MPRRSVCPVRSNQASCRWRFAEPDPVDDRAGRRGGHRHRTRAVGDRRRARAAPPRPRAPACRMSKRWAYSVPAAQKQNRRGRHEDRRRIGVEQPAPLGRRRAFRRRRRERRLRPCNTDSGGRPAGTAESGCLGRSRLSASAGCRRGAPPPSAMRENRTVRHEREQDHAVAAPGAARPDRRRGQLPQRAAIDADPIDRSFAKNPIDRLSGDQNGNDAPSVPASGDASPVSSERSHSIGRPSDDATNASFSPSGESANDTRSVVGGVVISTRISRSARRPERCRARTHAVLPAMHSEQRRGPQRSVRGADDVRRSADGRVRLACEILQRESRVADVGADAGVRSFSRHRRSRRRTAGGRLGGRRDQSGSRADDGGDDLGRVGAVEGATPGEHLEQHAAERPDVGAAIDGLAARLLGAHVRRRAEDHADARHRRAGDRRRACGPAERHSARRAPPVG